MRLNPADPRKRRAERSRDPVEIDRTLAQTGQRSRHYAELLLNDLWNDIFHRPQLAEDAHAPGLVGPILANSPHGPEPVVAAPEHFATMLVPGPFGRPNGYKLSLIVQGYSTLVPLVRRQEFAGMEAHDLPKSTSVQIGLALRSPEIETEKRKRKESKGAELRVNPLYWFLGNRQRWDLTYRDHVDRKIPSRFWSTTTNFDLMRTWDQALAEVTRAIDQLYEDMGIRLDAPRRLLAQTAQRAGSLDPEAVWAYVRDRMESFDRYSQPLMTIPGPLIGHRPPSGRSPIQIQAWNASGDGVVEAAVTCLARYLERDHKAVILKLRGADAYDSEQGWFSSATIELTSTRAKKTRNPLQIRVLWDRMNYAWAGRGEEWIGNELPLGGVWSINMVNTPGTAADLAAPAEKWIKTEFPDALIQTAAWWAPGTTRPVYRPEFKWGGW